MLRLFFLLLGCCCLLGLAAPTVGAARADGKRAQPDSAQLQNPMLPDSVRLKLLGELSAAYGPQDLRLGLHYARQKFELARRVGNKIGEVMAADDLAVCYARTGDLPSALRYYLHELRLAQRYGFTMREALAYLGQALVLSEEHHIAEASTSYRQALAAAEQSQNPRLLAYMQSEMGNFLLRQKRYSEAEQLLRTALPSFQKMGARKYESECLMYLASLTSSQGRYAEALEFGEQALRTSPSPDPYFLARTYNELSRAALGQGNYPLARRYAEQAMTQARASQSPETEEETVGMLIRLTEQEADWANAFYLQKRLTHLRDSVQTEKRTTEVARLQTQFETVKKQQAIRALTDQSQQQQVLMRWLLAGLALLVVALVVVAVLSIRLRRTGVALQRSNTAKDQLLSIVGHDLRGPVAAFQQVGPMLRYYARQPNANDLNELAEEMEHGAHRLAALLDNLLNWARAQMGEVVNRPEAVSVHEAVGQVIGLYRPTAVAKHLTIQSDIHEAVPPAWADPALLATVLRNLVSNAVKFSYQGGVIRLTVLPSAAGLEFSVTDNGVGMTAENLTALFQPAVRPTRGTTGEEGTGLGVAVCRHFVELLGGKLHASSAPGTGSRFWFTVPAAPQHEIATFPVVSLN